jgi:hypothetical protein
MGEFEYRYVGFTHSQKIGLLRRDYLDNKLVNTFFHTGKNNIIRDK